ncbi:MAG: hypothetical protein Q4E33_05380 [Erysipelotrichaceae bacterium]|nr:hypothetical protein [Erysipelotrichaceae bacterium]
MAKELLDKELSEIAGGKEVVRTDHLEAGSQIFSQTSVNETYNESSFRNAQRGRSFYNRMISLPIIGRAIGIFFK